MKKTHFLFPLLLAACTGSHNAYVRIAGFTMGTVYHITHNHPDTAAVQAGVDSVLRQVSRSLSVYDPQSVISRINRNETVVPDSLFTAVFLRSCEVSAATGGAFDISASPLFNAWGFGFEKRDSLTPAKIDSLRAFCGMQHIRLEDGHMVKDDPRVTLNANAIAKGFGVDAVCRFLDGLHIADYLVEIGGELRCKGKNSRGTRWMVAIDRPFDGNIFPGEYPQRTLCLTDRALATSGNYRRYYEEGGKKYAHTIDPVGGYPVTHRLLSATVLAVDCMSADAFATAFMVLGLDGSRELLAQHPELGACLIYEEKGTLMVYATPDVLCEPQD